MVTGRLGMVRLFYNEDMAAVYAHDAEGLTPLNHALRGKQRDCAAFLLTKQWAKVGLGVTVNVELGQVSVNVGQVNVKL